MISKTIGYNGVHNIFRQTHVDGRWPGRCWDIHEGNSFLSRKALLQACCSLRALPVFGLKHLLMYPIGFPPCFSWWLNQVCYYHCISIMIYYDYIIISHYDGWIPTCCGGMTQSCFDLRLASASKLKGTRAEPGLDTCDTSQQQFPNPFRIPIKVRK